jgi:hypothetical protein
MKKLVAGLVGFVVGLLLFAVGRELWLALHERPAGMVVNNAITAVGQLGWVDTTLVTGLAAVTAAYFSIDAVRRQMAQVDRIEEDKKDARHAAARAMLSLSLSSLCDYATKCARITYDLTFKYNGLDLSLEAVIPEYPPLPDGALAVIREMIEVVDAKDRKAFSKLVSTVQVHASRINGMREDYLSGHHRPNLIEVDQYVYDAAEIYARASALFRYARWTDEDIQSNIDQGKIDLAFHLMGLGGFERLSQERRTQWLS